MIKEILIALLGISVCFGVTCMFAYFGYMDLFITGMFAIFLGIMLSIWVAHQIIQEEATTASK